MFSNFFKKNKNKSPAVPPKEELLSWEKSYDSLINHRTGRQMFLDFLKEIEENNKVLFLKEGKIKVEERNTCPEDAVLDGRKYQIFETQEAIGKEEFEEEIEKLKEYDSYQNFLKSEKYLSLLRAAEEQAGQNQPSTLNAA